MQGGIVACGQSFSLPKCIASKECKSRIRRTKEERRSMVLSFITKYQCSNHGKFPSLNLTHKEVGGSFYTVREIVRDLIQENKVLGPGNPSSKLLKLEYFSDGDEDKDKGSFLYFNENLSFIDADFDTSPDLLTKNGKASLKDDLSKGSVRLHERLFSSRARVSNTFFQAAEDENALASEEQKNAEVLHNGSRDYPTDLLSVYSISSEEEHFNNIPLTTHCFEENSNFSESLLGTSLISAEIADDHSNFNAEGDNHKVLPISTVFDTSQISSSVYEVQLPSDPYVKVDIISNSELELEERRVDAAEGKNVDNFLLQTIRFPAFEDTENDTQSVNKTTNFVDVVKVSENASSKLLKLIIIDENHSDIKDANQLDVEVTNHSDIKLENQSDIFSAVKGGGFIRSLKGGPAEELEMLETETNHMWATIKAFIFSVIKFWSN